MEATVRQLCGNRLARDRKSRSFIGPEGGFDETEIEKAREAGVVAREPWKDGFSGQRQRGWRFCPCWPSIWKAACRGKIKKDG